MEYCASTARNEARDPFPTLSEEQARRLIDALVGLIRYVFEHGEIPRAWARTVIVAIAKVSSPKSGDDVRGISLTSHVAKLCSSIIARRLGCLQLGQWQCGFRAKRGTNHAIAAATQLIQAHVAAGVQLHGVFIDCTKAFDTVHRDVLIQTLQRYGVGPNTISIVKATFDDEINVRDSEERFSSCAGVRQGDNMSPTLFVIVMDMIVRIAQLEPFLVPRQSEQPPMDATLLGYADDLLLMDSDPARLQRNFDRLTAAMRQFGLELNVKKTKHMATSVFGKLAVSREALDAMTKRTNDA